MKADEQFKCKDCDNYNLCEYYHNRRETSSICKEFRNQWGFIEELEKIREKIKSKRDLWIKGRDAEWHTYDRCIGIIDNHIEELKGDKCDNDHDCEHCDWVECPEMKGEQK